MSSMKNYVITIARGYGSGGKKIGQLLGKQLGIPCYEEEIIKMASDKSGIAESIFQNADEKNQLGKWKRFVYKWALGMEDDTKGISGRELFEAQKEVIQELARTQSCIIVGKCADHVLRYFNNVVSVYIEAPRVECLRRLREKYGWSDEEAAERIMKMDHQRAAYYRVYAGGEWTDPMNYDLTLNSMTLGEEGCAKLITECLKYKVLEER